MSLPVCRSLNELRQRKDETEENLATYCANKISFFEFDEENDGSIQLNFKHNEISLNYLNLISSAR